MRFRRIDDLTKLAKWIAHAPHANFCWRPPLCIVGSGPSAFYAAQFLLRHHNSVCVDIYEKLPAPFGLIRYGVAPDHPDVKKVINTFTEVAKSPRFNFIGNVTVGIDIRIRELQQSYSAVLLAYGASVDRRLRIPGEDFLGVLSAKDLVAWYNGSPGLSEFEPSLNCETVVVVGMGNVSLDVARILLSSATRLKNTDIPEPVIAALSDSKIRRVVIVGRRGPLQAAFTLKEFRELCRLADSESPGTALSVNLIPPDVMFRSLGNEESIARLLPTLARPRRRLTQYLLDLSHSKVVSHTGEKQCDIVFCRSPVRILPSDTSETGADSTRVGGIELAPNQLLGPPSESQEVSPDPNSPHEFLKCGLVVRSIGYRSVQIDPDIPFDLERGIIKSKDSKGRVITLEDESLDSVRCPLYCTGWAKRGASGVIADTAIESRDTSQAILLDLAAAELHRDPRVVDKQGFPAISEILKNRGVRVMSFADWERVDAIERQAGKELGKPREKLTTTESILYAAFRNVRLHKAG